MSADRRSKRLPDAPPADPARELRIRYRYHDLVLRGKVKISLETAKRLVGPDRAYHLYGRVSPRRRQRP